jgi:tetratricopeptide (TPR) repeat protein
MTHQTPDELAYWLESLHVHEEWEEAWAETYDWAAANWQLDICWRLLREARRLASSPAQQAMVRYREGLLHAQTGDWQRAAACYEAALAHTADDDYGLRLPLLSEMGMLFRLQGDYQKALEYHQRQRELAETIGDLWHQAEAGDQIGLDYEAAGRLADARQSLQLALQLWTQLDVEDALVSAHKHLGLVAWGQGKLDEAEFHLRQAHDLATTVGDLYGLAQTEGNLGNLAYERAQLDTAETHYVGALRSFDQLGVIFDKIGILNNLGNVAFAREQYDQADSWYRESLALSQTLGHKQGELDAWLNLSAAALGRRQWTEVPAFYQQALTIARSLQIRGVVWTIRKRQIRFFVLLTFLRFLGWLRRRFGATKTHMEGN